MKPVADASPDLLSPTERAAREARRAGREREFEALAPYLERDPRQQELELLRTQLRWSDAALELALASLRRRVRELARRREA
jgi:hypothetical protein